MSFILSFFKALFSSGLAIPAANAFQLLSQIAFQLKLLSDSKSLRRNAAVAAQSEPRIHSSSIHLMVMRESDLVSGGDTFKCGR